MNTLFLWLATMAFSYPILDSTQIASHHAVDKALFNYSIIGTWKGVDEIKVTHHDTIKIYGIPVEPLKTINMRTTIRVHFIVEFKSNGFFEVTPTDAEVLKTEGITPKQIMDFQYLPEKYYKKFIQQNQLDCNYFTIGSSNRQNVQNITLHTKSKSTEKEVIASSHNVEAIFLSERQVNLKIPLNNGSPHLITLTK